jgi:hypothetical protein
LEGLDENKAYIVLSGATTGVSVHRAQRKGQLDFSAKLALEGLEGNKMYIILSGSATSNTCGLGISFKQHSRTTSLTT